MTLRELSKLYYIKKHIARLEDKIAEIDGRLDPGVGKVTGMPHNPSPQNNVELMILTRIDTEEKLKREIEEYVKERERLEEYINSVTDPHIRLIMLYRFVDLLTWGQIAAKIGGNNTEGSVSQACYNFIKKSRKK